jgi:hypothetical protein
LIVGAPGHAAALLGTLAILFGGGHSAT